MTDMNVEEIDGICRIALAGKLDARGSESIELKFTALTAHRDRVAIDLAGVDFLASIGIRMLVMAGKAAARRNGKLVMFGAVPQVLGVIASSGLGQVVPLVADWSAARDALE